MPMHSLRRAPEVELDGDWDFQLRPTPTAPPADAWKTVKVPSLWTMHESVDPPHYTNVAMPFDEVPPTVPLRNPTGVYRRGFELSPTAARRAILHVGAAEGLLRVLVNDEAVGVSSDSHLAAEFDITDACASGQNTVELVVAKWSAVSYLEDQDHWWQAGISRSVYLYTVPEVRLADLSVVSDFDPATQQGSLRVTVSTSGLAHLFDVGWSVEIEVLGQTATVPVTARVRAPTLPPPSDDRSSRPAPRLPPDYMDLLSLNAASAPIPPELRAIPGLFTQMQAPASAPGTALFTSDELDVVPWSAETPHLEDLVVRLVSADGAVTDETRTKIGFRRVEVEGRDLLVNGRRILVQGVNRHDFHPVTGRVLSREDLLAELSLLKRCNVNAIRTSHYPNDPEFLDLCDEIGFYVVDEADIEGHAFASTIGDDPRYLTAFLERVMRMVQRDRNRPSVIAWSLGNETGYGANHDAAAGWLRRFDPSRPLHYEGAISTDWHAGHAVTDIVCPMYAAFDALKAYAADPRADRPLVLCEYAYSQGNSTGGLAEYWELFETLPGLQGGFIWEFKDHGLDPDDEGRYRYGGDFGDHPNDGPVCLNGVVFPDNTPKPALNEARGIFSPVRIVSGPDDAVAGTITVHNRQTFNDLSAYAFELQVETRDGPRGAVAVELPQVPAGGDATLDVPTAVQELLHTASPLALTLTVRTRNPAVWAPAGTTIAVLQVALPRGTQASPQVRGSAAAPVDEKGAIGHPLLHRPPQLCLWRALTDNDRSFALDQRFVRSGFFRLAPTSVRREDAGDGVTVTTLYATAWGDEVVHRRTIGTLADGDYVLAEQVTLPEGTHDGLRVGMELELVDGFEDAQWVGLGPWENYPDRRSSALLGCWSSTIDGLAVPYIVPQENGGRGEVTELRLTGPAGTVSTVHSVPLQMNVGRCSHDELEAAQHWWELPHNDTTIVHLDVAHRGLGTTLLGPDTRPRYRLDGCEYSWEWRLTLED
ncbi:MAG: glycoside hydrolase family 2 TIM barrel-domain containing protein [Acidimicrobiales bacterium]